MMMRFNFECIILAAGKSTRFKKDKLILKFKNKLIIEHSVNKFLSYKNCVKIIIITNFSNFKTINQIYKSNPLIKIIKVNTNYRHESVLQGLKLINSQKVLIHDGARFKVDKKTINNVLKGLKDFKAVVPYVECTNTISLLKGKFLIGKLQRSNLAVCQTPQGFDTKIIKEAMIKKKTKILSDCVSYLDFSKFKVNVVKGNKENIKLTFPKDLYFLL